MDCNSTCDFKFLHQVCITRWIFCTCLRTSKQTMFYSIISVFLCTHNACNYCATHYYTVISNESRRAWVLCAFARMCVAPWFFVLWIEIHSLKFQWIHEKNNFFDIFNYIWATSRASLVCAVNVIDVHQYNITFAYRFTSEI